VKECNGEILKFIGDGVLAVFADKSSSNACSVCTRGSRVAHAFQRRLVDVNKKLTEDGLDPEEIGVGLHYGICSYGNVGALGRLDFTVIGNGVNVASRVEGLCSKLQARSLATGTFFLNLVQNDDWQCHGNQKLKGVSDL
jgi:adenylate cyclase